MHARPNLASVVHAWGTPAWRHVFQSAVAALGAGQLPLQQALAHSSRVGEGAPHAIILHHEATERCLRIKAGIVYTGVTAGCSCADDPTPPAEQQEYCELLFEIERDTGNVTITLLPD